MLFTMADLMRHACFTLSTDEVYLREDSLNISFLNGDWVIEICLNRDNEDFPFAESGIYLCKDTPTEKEIFVTSRTCIELWDKTQLETTELRSRFDDKISSSNIWSVPTAVFKHYVSDMECYRSFLKIELWFSETPVKQQIEELREGPLSCSIKNESGLERLSLDFNKLLRDELNTDVVIKVGHSTFNAHQLVLSARSDVFKAMFQHDMTETATNTVNIEDFDNDILDIFLEYLYTGRFPQTTMDTVCDLYRIADKYAVIELKKLCATILSYGLSLGNACHVLRLADSHSDATLKTRVTDFILENEDILFSSEWISFSEEAPKLAVEVYREFVDRIVQKKVLLGITTTRKSIPSHDCLRINNS